MRACHVGDSSSNVALAFERTLTTPSHRRHLPLSDLCWRRLGLHNTVKTTSLPLGGAILFCAPWLVVRHAASDLAPWLVAALAGVAILGAAFLLAWAAELIQVDISQALALALLALIAVLPEYAVDAVFAFQAGQDPAVAQEGYAIANMTGANRLLIGIGWSSIVLVAWWRHGSRSVRLDRGQFVELGILLAASVYALSIPLKGELNLVDTLVLVGLFGIYTWATARAPAAEPELAGPVQVLGRLPSAPRRGITLAMFAFAALVIFLAAEPFAHGLVATGAALHVDEFLLVQWLAPLASEAPELVVAMLFVWRGHASSGMRTLISSKVNQWTLLVATLPLVFSLGAGALEGMPLVARQQQELWLTAAQSLFAIVLISDFEMQRWKAAALIVPFVAQLVLPTHIGPIDTHVAFSVAYLSAAVGLLLHPRWRAAIPMWRTRAPRRGPARTAPRALPR
jgi:cation:H+ antiporter